MTRSSGHRSSPAAQALLCVALATLPKDIGEHLRVDASATAAPHDSWTRAVQAYFRRQADGWKLVGLERQL